MPVPDAHATCGHKLVSSSVPEYLLSTSQSSGIVLGGLGVTLFTMSPVSVDSLPRWNVQ